ncbi:MAG: hypothetical protein AAF569_05180 [Pseudomonadota bacterium]
MLQSLNKHKAIDTIYVCDRSDENNAHFYRDRIPVNNLTVYGIDEKYSYETRNTYKSERMALESFDALWLFLDHPVSPEFLIYLNDLMPDTCMMNAPMGILETSSKAILTDMRREIDCIDMYLPAIKLCTSVEDVELFRAKHGDTVLKALRDFGGAGVKRYKNYETDLKDTKDVQAFLEHQNRQCLAMAYLNNPDQSDKRTLVFRGQILGSVLRRAAKGGWLCNIASGGSAEMSSPNIEEKTLIDVIDPWLQSKGIYYYGIDTLKDENGRRLLSEINTLNIGGVQIIQDMSGIDVCDTVTLGFCKLIQDHHDQKISKGAFENWSYFFSELG